MVADDVVIYIDDGDRHSGWEWRCVGRQVGTFEIDIGENGLKTVEPKLSCSDSKIR